MAIEATSPANGAAIVGDSASAGGVKREADGPAEGQPTDKSAKVEENGTSVKLERRDSAVSDLGKEKKEKKDKSEKKDKEKKDKKEDKKVKKEDVKQEPAIRKMPTAEEMKFDHRKLMKEGQKQLTPPVADATRGFYSSLLAENPNSKIAIKFCIEYGILPITEHKILLKKYNALKEKGAFDPRKQASMSISSMKKGDKGGDDKKDKNHKEGKEGKDKKEKKDKDDKEKKEKKDKKEKDAKDVKTEPSASP